MPTPAKTRVAVVFGGRSTEHAISCLSAGGVLAALDPDEFEIVPVGITREGRWILTDGDPRALSLDARRALPEITAASLVPRMFTVSRCVVPSADATVSVSV